MDSPVLPSDLFTAGLSQADAVYSGGKVLPQVNLFWKHPHRTFLRQVPYLIPDPSRGQPVLTISACLVYRCQPYRQPCTCGALSGSLFFFFLHVFQQLVGSGILAPIQSQTLFSIFPCLCARKDLTCFMWYFAVSQLELPLGLGQIFNIFRRTDLFMMFGLSIIYHVLCIHSCFLNETPNIFSLPQRLTF